MRYLYSGSAQDDGSAEEKKANETEAAACDESSHGFQACCVTKCTERQKKNEGESAMSGFISRLRDPDLRSHQVKMRSPETEDGKGAHGHNEHPRHDNTGYERYISH